MAGRWSGAHVRFGSKADICAAKCHVRFAPESGHELGSKWQRQLRTIAAKTPNEKADQKDYETYAGDSDDRLSVMRQTSSVPRKISGDKDPHSNPQRRSDGIEQQEAPPGIPKVPATIPFS
jgi:hypothetical protein